MQVLTKISFVWYRVLIYYFFLGKWGTSGEEFEFISSGMSIGILLPVEDYPLLGGE